MVTAVCLLGYLFGGDDDPCKTAVPSCLDAADANDDGKVNTSDAITLLRYIFLGGAPPAPFTTCGYDETHDELRCFEFAGCE